MNFEPRDNELPQPEVEELLSALLDDQLPVEQVAELRERLERDPRLGGLYSRLESQRASLRGLKRVPASDDLPARVLAELRERAVVVELPHREAEETGPRGGWRSVYVLVGSLAAVLMLGVFLWPREGAEDSPRLADADAEIRRREVESRKELLEQVIRPAEPVPAIVQQSPIEPRPEVRNAVPDGTSGRAEAGEKVGMAGSSSTHSDAPGSRPSNAAGAEGLAGAARTHEVEPAAAADALPRAAKEVESPQLSARNEVAEELGTRSVTRSLEAGRLSGLRKQPELDPGGGNRGGGNAAAEPVPATATLEVWLVDSVDEAPLAGGSGGREIVGASAVEVYFAQATEPRLPQWLEELQTNAEVTELDPAESAELLQRLQASPEPRGVELQGLQSPPSDSTARRAPAAPVPAKPSESASSVLDEPAKELAANLPAEEPEQATAGPGITWLRPADPVGIDALFQRFNARNRGNSGSALGSGDAGGNGDAGGGQSAAAAGQTGKNPSHNLRDDPGSLASKLEQLRAAVKQQESRGQQPGSDRSDRSRSGEEPRMEPYSQSAGSGRATDADQPRRQVVIIVRFSQCP